MDTRPFITAIDLGSVTGVAFGLAGDRPTLATWKLEGESRAERLVDLDNKLARHLDRYSVDLIAVEAPLKLRVLLRIGSKDETIAFMRGAQTMVEQRCFRAGVKFKTWEVVTARKAITGRGMFRRGESKKAIMQYCRLLKFDPANFNESDALIGFLFESSLLYPARAYRSTPLFCMSA